MKWFALVRLALIAAVLPHPSLAAEDENILAFNTHCRTCHAFKQGDHRLGPSLFGIFGAEGGRVEGYRGYSGALSGVTWDAATLDRFIADPSSISTSTNMIFPRLSEASERAKIIEYLKSISPH